MTINKTKVFAIFQDADNVQASLATRLFDEGIYDRTQALPLVIEFVEQKYKVKATMGQRGLMFEKNSASEQAKKRILANCFETAPKTKANTQNKKDPIDALLAKIKALPKSAQKRIKDAI